MKQPDNFLASDESGTSGHREGRSSSYSAPEFCLYGKMQMLTLGGSFSNADSGNSGGNQGQGPV